MKKTILVMPLAMLGLLASCGGSKSKSNNWWDNTDQLTEKDIGKIEEIEVNNIKQQVRLIGIDHDTLADGSNKKAHTTWEFVNLLCDGNGYSLTTLWDTANYRAGPGADALNYDFINSDLRKSLDGLGEGNVIWYEKGAGNKSEFLYNKPVTEMLPEDLQSVLKTVIKPIEIHDDKPDKEGIYWHVNNAEYRTNMFVLSGAEMTEDKLDSQGISSTEGTTYSYYVRKTTLDSRIKHQISWHDTDLTEVDGPRIYDYPYKEKVTDEHFKYGSYMNTSGYNSDENINYGGLRWLRSPNITSDRFPVAVIDSGEFSTYNYPVRCSSGTWTGGVAPAFCI